MSIAIPVPVGFGWVIASGVASLVTAFMLGNRVGLARKKHGVDYPTMYDNAKPAFNAVQRGHQNMLETHYAMLWLMTLGGLKHPLGSAIAGAVYSVGRIVYAYGYESGDVKKRVYGSLFFYPAYFTAVGFTVSLMGTLLGYW